MELEFSFFPIGSAFSRKQLLGRGRPSVWGLVAWLPKGKQLAGLGLYESAE